MHPKLKLSSVTFFELNAKEREEVACWLKELWV